MLGIMPFSICVRVKTASTPGYSRKNARRIKLVESPVMAINETKQYTILRPDGKAWQFYFPLEVKSFITHPSPGLNMKGPGFYEISGISFSGNGRVSKVEVSADGGKSWGQAALQAPVLSKAFTRFRIPWNWDGGTAILQSRATDEAGNVQPSRETFIAERSPPKGTPNVAAFTMEHCNAITSWGINDKGEVSHVYA
jgi:sulfane dehydrogenase subunit SoxC